MANLAKFKMFSPPEADPKVFMSSGDDASLSILAGSVNSAQVALQSAILSNLRVEVDVQGAGVVKVEPALVSAGRNDMKVFEITGMKAGGAMIEARIRDSGRTEASLSVLVRDDVKIAKPVPKFVPGTPLQNFEVGFIEGLATVNGKRNVDLLVTAIKTRPGQFYAGYFDGCIRGLWAGVKDLFDGLVELGAIAPYVAAAIAVPGIGAAIAAWKLSDPEFRKKAAEHAAWARSVAESAKGVVVEFNKDPRGSVEKYLAASREAGRKIGEAFAAEIDNRAVLGGPIEYGEWIGWVVGRIGFEVIVLIATEGIGDAVKAASAGGQGLKGLRVVGEGAELFARVRSKIQEVLESLPALKNFVETLTKTKSATQASEAAKATEAAHAVPAIEGATEVRMTLEEYKAALGHVFPSDALDPVASMIDGVGSRAAKRAVENPRFMQAIQQNNMTLAGTLYHSAAAQEIREISATAVPKGWKVTAEYTLKAGKGGSRADVFLEGPAGELVEFDWKTTGQSGLKSISQMEKHAGQVRALKNGASLASQQSRSWTDYVRALLPKN